MRVQLIPAGIVALGIPLLRASPTWLLKKGREEDAVKVYSYIRNLPPSHPYILEDVAVVKAQLELENAITIDDSGRTSFLRFLRRAAKESMSKRGTQSLRVGGYDLPVTGLGVERWRINYYSPTIFTSIGLDNTTLWTGIYGLIKAVSFYHLLLLFSSI